MKPLRLLLLALAGSALLVAQAVSNRMVAEIPFDFEMANLKLPAGEYLVSDFLANQAIQVHNPKARKRAVSVQNVLHYEPSEKADVRLIFNKYGDRCFLSEIWYPNISRVLPKSKTERELVTSTLITRNVERIVIYARIF